MRRCFYIFLLMLLPLHSFAMQGGWLSTSDAYNLSHEIEHLEGISHHHHDDSTHYDESKESADHFADHAASAQTAALPSSITFLSPLLTFSSVISEHRNYIPDPILERPQRPPSSLA